MSVAIFLATSLHSRFFVAVQKQKQTFMVAEDLHAWLCVWIVRRLEAHLTDTCITSQTTQLQLDQCYTNRTTQTFCI